MTEYARELIILTGLISLGYGLYLEHPPLAFIVDGAILSAIGIFGVARVGA